MFLIGLISISDRASRGDYQDMGLPTLQTWLEKAIKTPWHAIKRLISDEQTLIESTLKELVDVEGCGLIFTTGGTGPSPRDVTPEATLSVADKVLPGFGEQMRQISLNFVPTAILSRQTAVIRGKSLIINLPGQPKSIVQILAGLQDESGAGKGSGIFSAIPYCLDLIGADYIEINEDVITAFRPKK